MKLLFLDVDGVLNNAQVIRDWRITEQESSDPLSEDLLKNLSHLVSVTDCKIVVSSTWRLFPESMESLKTAFGEHGIPEWIGTTPCLRTGRRADEIISWLESNLVVPSVAVGIDDDEDIDIGVDHGLPVQFKPLKTSFYHGLTSEVVLEAIDWFKQNNF